MNSPLKLAIYQTKHERSSTMAHLLVNNKWEKTKDLTDLLTTHPFLNDVLYLTSSFHPDNNIPHKKTINGEVYFLKSIRYRPYTLHLLMIVCNDNQQVDFIVVGIDTFYDYCSGHLRNVSVENILRLISNFVEEDLGKSQIDDHLKEILSNQQKSGTFNVLTFTDDV